MNIINMSYCFLFLTVKTSVVVVINNPDSSDENEMTFHIILPVWNMSYYVSATIDIHKKKQVS